MMMMAITLFVLNEDGEDADDTDLKEDWIKRGVSAYAHEKTRRRSYDGGWQGHHKTGSQVERHLILGGWRAE